MTAYLLERAWVDGAVHDDVRVEIEAGRFTSVEVAAAADGAESLAGLTIPGLANCHSHAFHRALRGRTQRGQGTFWTWRGQMYAVAARVDPDSYLGPATAPLPGVGGAGGAPRGGVPHLPPQLHGQPHGAPHPKGP